MPIKFSCPQCRTTVGILDRDTGRKLRCPHCAAVFQGPQPAPVPEVVPVLALETVSSTEPPPSEPLSVIPVLTLDEPLPEPLPPPPEQVPVPEPPPPPPPEQEPSPEPAPPPVESAQLPPPAFAWEAADAGPPPLPPLAAGWHRVCSGLICLSVSAASTGLAGLSLLLTMPLFQPAAPVVPPAALALVLVTAGMILWLAGQLQCCSVPAESGLRGLILNSALASFIGGALQAFGVLAVFGSQWLVSEGVLDFQLAHNLENLGGACGIIGLAVPFLAGLVFLFFLHGAARFFRDQRLARSIFRFALIVPLLPVLAIPFGFLAFVAARSGAGPGFAGAGVVLIEVGAGSLTVVWFLILLLRLRATIGTALRSQERPTT